MGGDGVLLAQFFCYVLYFSQYKLYSFCSAVFLNPCETAVR